MLLLPQSAVVFRLYYKRMMNHNFGNAIFGNNYQMRLNHFLNEKFEIRYKNILFKFFISREKDIYKSSLNKNNF